MVEKLWNLLWINFFFRNFLLEDFRILFEFFQWFFFNYTSYIFPVVLGAHCPNFPFFFYSLLDRFRHFGCLFLFLSMQSHLVTFFAPCVLRNPVKARFGIYIHGNFSNCKFRCSFLWIMFEGPLLGIPTCW